MAGVFSLTEKTTPVQLTMTYLSLGEQERMEHGTLELQVGETGGRSVCRCGWENEEMAKGVQVCMREEEESVS